MKNTFLVCFLLLITNFFAFAQVQKLNELATGKIIDYKVIFEEDNDDVFGYFFLYQKDRKSKKVYEFEYVILDKNLNKITSNSFIEFAFRMNLIKNETKLSMVVKQGDKVVFGLHDAPKDGRVAILYDFYNTKYRTIDLNNFELSESYVVQNNKVREGDIEEDKNLSIIDLSQRQILFPIYGSKFLLFGIGEGLEYDYKFFSFASTGIRKAIKATTRFKVLDENFDVLYDKPNHVNQKRNEYLKYMASDKDLLMLSKIPFLKNTENEFSLRAYDIHTGEFINEFDFIDKEKGFKLKQETDVQFFDNHLVVYFRYFDEKNEIEYDNNLGIAKYVFDKKTFEVISKDFISIPDMTPYIVEDIQEKIKKINFSIYDLRQLANGHTIGMIRTYYNQGTQHFNEVFTFELDDAFKIIEFYKVSDAMPGIDYQYMQELDSEGNFVFFYLRNDSYRRDSSLGIVTYVEGAFEASEIKLKTDKSEIFPGRAKNGYIRILEVKDDVYEIRLERINY